MIGQVDTAPDDPTPDMPGEGVGTPNDGDREAHRAVAPSAAVFAHGPARRRIAVAFVAVALISGAIWALQSGALPLPGRASGTAGEGFVTFGSQGIKLGAAGSAAPKIGEPAPEFTLLDTNGNVVRLSNFRGKTVVVNFWATWCSPCRQEFPELVRTYDRQAGRGLVVLGVDLQEGPKVVREFADEFSARFPIVIDAKGDVAKQYRLLGLPTTMFIDTAGVIRGQHVGVLTSQILTKKLAEADFTEAR